MVWSPSRHPEEQRTATVTDRQAPTVHRQSLAQPVSGDFRNGGLPQHDIPPSNGHDTGPGGTFRPDALTWKPPPSFLQTRQWLYRRLEGGSSLIALARYRNDPPEAQPHGNRIGARSRSREVVIAWPRPVPGTSTHKYVQVNFGPFARLLRCSALEHFSIRGLRALQDEQNGSKFPYTHLRFEVAGSIALIDRPGHGGRCHYLDPRPVTGDNSREPAPFARLRGMPRQDCHRHFHSWDNAPY